jgi:hypothetical protein
VQRHGTTCPLLSSPSAGPSAVGEHELADEGDRAAVGVARVEVLDVGREVVAGRADDRDDLAVADRDSHHVA